ncbi:hypothetical protein M513_04500 [Trichuris suis]|uniref:RecA family profile 1 domain-containing protein n=1 Tax=Trichuris suis TaxID=68888 RepID=A0A085MBF9_9BILA|nr:hypothetical protein M513_04500 [Trichuris suis]
MSSLIAVSVPTSSWVVERRAFGTIEMAGHFRCHCSVDCHLILLSGVNLYHEICNNIAVYGCGNEQLDSMLKGGFYSNELTEVSGPVGSGKSQLCLCFMANLIANTDGRVLFIDSTGSFSALRIAEILLAKHSVVEMKEVGDLLKRVIYEKSYAQKQLDEILDSICANVNDIRNNLKAVVVDHVSTLLSPTLIQERMQGMQNMMRTAVRLRDLAKRYNLCVVVVNNATETESGELEPSLGPWWISIPDTRLLVRPIDDNLFSVQLLRSVRADCDTSVTFSIGAQGLLSPCDDNLRLKIMRQYTEYDLVQRTIPPPDNPSNRQLCWLNSKCRMNGMHYSSGPKKKRQASLGSDGERTDDDSLSCGGDDRSSSHSPNDVHISDGEERVGRLYSNGQLKFSVDNILRPDFGCHSRSLMIASCVKSHSFAPFSSPTSEPSCTLSKSYPDFAGSNGISVPSLPPVLWPAWVYCTRYSDRPSSVSLCHCVANWETKDNQWLVNLPTPFYTSSSCDRTVHLFLKRSIRKGPSSDSVNCHCNHNHIMLGQQPSMFVPCCCHPKTLPTVSTTKRTAAAIDDNDRHLRSTISSNQKKSERSRETSSNSIHLKAVRSTSLRISRESLPD